MAIRVINKNTITAMNKSTEMLKNTTLQGFGSEIHEYCQKVHHMKYTINTGPGVNEHPYKILKLRCCTTCNVQTNTLFTF